MMKKTIRGVSLLVPASLLALLMGCVAPADEVDEAGLGGIDDGAGEEVAEASDALGPCGALGAFGAGYGGCGAGWSDWATFPGLAGVYSAPSIASWGGTPYMAYIGAGNQCFMSSYVNSAWAAPAAIPGCFGPTVPSLAVFNNSLYAGYCGGAGSGCFLNTYNNWGWASPYAIPGCDGGCSPVIAPYANALALAYSLPNQTVNFTTCTGLGGCGAPVAIPGVTTAFAPALGVLGGALTLAYTGGASQVYTASFGGCGAGCGGCGGCGGAGAGVGVAGVGVAGGCGVGAGIPVLGGCGAGAGIPGLGGCGAGAGVPVAGGCGGCGWGAPYAITGAYSSFGPTLGYHDSSMYLAWARPFGGFGYAPYLNTGWGQLGSLGAPYGAVAGGLGYFGGQGWGLTFPHGGSLYGAYCGSGCAW